MPDPLTGASAAGLHGVGADDFEELRLAVVMNGGVSLAVWIGGVTHEVNRAVSGAGLYGQLLALTATVARVDVISGTSAGGINGAMLALARAYGVDLASMRDLWLDKGRLHDLLRSSTDMEPTSLLLGNERFLVDLRNAFAQLRGSGTLVPPADAPIDLTLTTTVLHGQPRRIVDDLGQIVSDVTHRGTFRFARGSHVETDVFDRGDIVDRLALAARGTASFPIAFEPVYCTVNPPPGARTATAPDMTGVANFKTSRYVVDGGVLDNKPLEAAIDAVMRQRAHREVRRVLAYVVPSPGDTASEKDDDPAHTPEAGAVALNSLVNLPRAESISRELAQIVNHNASVRRRRETRLGLVRQFGRAGRMQQVAADLFAMYVRRRRLGAAEFIVDELCEGLAALGPAHAIGRRRREWLVDTVAARDGVPWVPEALPSDTVALNAVQRRWGWGEYTVEHMAQLILELCRRSLVVSPLLERRGRDDRLRARLKAVFGQAHDLAAMVTAGRRSNRGFWRARAEALDEAMSAVEVSPAGDPVGTWLTAAVSASARLTREIVVPPHLHGLSAAWPLAAGNHLTDTVQGWLAWSFATLVAGCLQDFRAVATLGEQYARTETDQRAAEDLRAYVDFLSAERPEATASTVLAQMLALEVVQYAVGAHRDRDDQYFELVQFSADVAHPILGATTAAKKLAGAQLANFGGFYKRSWRANDWMFGRLDGANRLVRVLLNPARLARLYPNDPDRVLGALEAIAVPAGTLPRDRDYLESEWRRRLPAVRKELAYLSNPAMPVPEQLPQTADAVMIAHQLGVVRTELPVVVAAVLEDRKEGASDKVRASGDLVNKAHLKTANGTTWEALDAASLIDLYQNGSLGAERIADEVGADLFTSDVTRTMAVAVSLLSGPNSGLGPLRALLKGLQLPLIVVDVLMQNAIRDSKTTAFVSGAVFAGGLAVTLLALFADLLPATVEAIGVVAFVAFIAISLRGRYKLMFAWLGLCLLAYVAVWLLKIAR